MGEFIKRLELAFWDMVIPLLSESEFIRGSVRGVYTICSRKNYWILLLLMFWASVALIGGFLLGHAHVIIW
jgi:hypothetical protein